MATPTDELKNRLTKALSIRNLKPIDLVEMTHIPKSAISQYMSGYAKPKQDRLYLISKALNINEAWLLGYDVPMEKNSTDLSNIENEYEIEIIKMLKKLNDDGKKLVYDYTDTLIASKKYEITKQYNNIQSKKQA